MLIVSGATEVAHKEFFHELDSGFGPDHSGFSVASTYAFFPFGTKEFRGEVTAAPVSFAGGAGSTVIASGKGAAICIDDDKGVRSASVRTGSDIQGNRSRGRCALSRLDLNPSAETVGAFWIQIRARDGDGGLFSRGKLLGLDLFEFCVALVALPPESG